MFTEIFFNSKHLKTSIFLNFFFLFYLISCGLYKHSAECSSTVLCDGGITVKVGGMDDGMKVPAITKFHTVSSLKSCALFPKLFKCGTFSFRVVRFFPLCMICQLSTDYRSLPESLVFPPEKTRAKTTSCCPLCLCVCLGVCLNSFLCSPDSSPGHLSD